MDRSTIVEVTSWESDGREPGYYTALAELGAGGVVIKASQGISWTLPWLPAAIRGAKQAGLLVGVIHYAEPGLNGPELEAEHVMSSLPDDDLPLGVWLELDDLNGRPEFEMADWVKAWLDLAVTPKARPVLMCTSELYAQMAGAPFGRRLVLTTWTPESPSFWAVRRRPEAGEGQHEAPTVATAYHLATTRGLNAPQAPTAGQSTPPAPKPGPAAAEGAQKSTPAKAPASSKGAPVKVDE
jgi:hypothetical protein